MAGASVAVLLSLVTLAGPVMANPVNGQVVSGSITIAAPEAGTLAITQESTRGIINWDSFSIAPGETTRFIQPDSHAVTLNRVVGGDLSEIAGNLEANGRIFLINPNGILFTETAVVDVNSLIATTHDVVDADFEAGRYRFSGDSAVAGAVVENRGSITVAEAGLAALVAPSVVNGGTIQARLGTVALAAERTISVDFTGDGLINFEVDRSTVAAVAGSVRQNGSVTADGGHILLTADQAGRLLDSIVETGGTMDAGAGRVTLASGDVGRIGGTILANGAGTGGTVLVQGRRLTLSAGALVSASGDAAGGSVSLLAAGESSSLTLEDTATVRADARVAGDGGQVVLAAGGNLSLGGLVSADGVGTGGRGGGIELESPAFVLSGVFSSRGGPGGQGGVWQLAATNIHVGGQAADTPAGFSFLSAATLGALLETGVDVTLASRGGSGGAGNIVVDAAVTNTATGAGTFPTLTLAAHNDITLNAPVTGSGPGALSLVLRANDTLTGVTDPDPVSGSVLLNANIATNGGMLSASGRSVDFHGLVTTTGGAVEIRAVDEAHIAGAIATAGGRLVVSGGTARLGADLATGGADLEVSGNVLLDADTLLAVGDGIARFDGTVGAAADGGQSLTVTGNAAFVGTIGAAGQRLSALSVSGTSTIDADIGTSGNQSYGGPVTLAGDVSLTAGGSVAFGGTVDGARNLTIAADAGVVFSAAVGAAERLGALDLTGAGPTTLGASLRAASLAIAGPAALQGGVVDTTNSQVYAGAVSLGVDTTLSGGGSIRFAATLDGGFDLVARADGGVDFADAVGAAIPLGDLTVAGSASRFGGRVQAARLFLDGPARLDGGLISTTGVQEVRGAVTLGVDTELQAGGDITLSGPVDGAHALTLSSASAVRLDGALGAMTRLGELRITGSAPVTLAGAIRAAALSVAGPTTLATGSVDTTGSQSWLGALTLAADARLSAGDRIRFGSTVDGARALTVTAGAGAQFDGAVGLGTRLGDLVLDGIGPTTVSAELQAASLAIAGPASLNGGRIDTTGAQGYGGALTLGTATTLNAGGAIRIGASLDGGHDLTIGTPDRLTLAGPVGGIARLGALRVTGPGAIGIEGPVRSASLFLGAAATLSGGGIDTSGDQSYGGPVTLAGDGSLTAGGSVAFGGTVDGARNLTIAADAGVVFSAAVGAAQRLGVLDLTGAGPTTLGASLRAASLAIAGPASLNGPRIDTTDFQTLGGSITIGAESLALVAGGDIRFAGSINADGAAAPRSLTVTTAGITRFDQPVGAVVPLTDLIVDGGGSVLLAGGLLRTAGSLRLWDDLLLSAPTDDSTTLIAAQDIVLARIDGQTPDRERLTLNSGGDTQVTAAIGARSRLALLATDDTGRLSLVGVETVEAQDYREPAVTLSGTYGTQGNGIAVRGVLTLADPVRLSSRGGDVLFAQAINGPANADLIVEGAGGVRFGGSVAVGSVSVTDSGPTVVNGRTVVTVGDQSWGSTVLVRPIGADPVDPAAQPDTVSFRGRTLRFLAGADAEDENLSSGLSLTATEDLRLAGSFGALFPLRSLEAAAGGAIVLLPGEGSQRFVTVGETNSGGTAGPRAPVSGPQRWSGTLLIEGAPVGTVRMEAGGSAIDILGTVSGADDRSLVLDTAGPARLAGQVALGSLFSIGTGPVRFDADTLDLSTLLDITGPTEFTAPATVRTGGMVFRGSVTAPEHDLTLRADAGMDLLGAVGAGALDLRAGGGIRFGGGRMEAGRTLLVQSPLTLLSDATLSAQGIILQGDLSGAGLSLAGGQGGVLLAMEQAVLESLAITGATTFNRGDADGGETTITTTGAQIYHGPVTLHQDTRFTGGALTWRDVLNSAASARVRVAMRAEGDIRLEDHVGVDGDPGSTAAALGRLEVRAGTTTLDPGGGTLEIRTAPGPRPGDGEQLYAGTVRLGHGTVRLNTTGALSNHARVAGATLAFDRIEAETALPAERGRLVLLLGNASVSTSDPEQPGQPFVDVEALSVQGNNGVVELVGFIRGVGGEAAAKLVDKNLPRSNSYRVNGCAMGSPTCVVVAFADLAAPETVRLPPFRVVPNLDLFVRSVLDRGNEDMWYLRQPPSADAQPGQTTQTAPQPGSGGQP